MGNDEKQIRRGRNSSAEIAAKTGPLTDGKVMREVQQPGDSVRDRSTFPPPSGPHNTERAMSENLAPMKEDLPWNRCC